MAKAKLSKLTCEKCLSTGSMEQVNNVPNATQINCMCSNCGHTRSYSVIKPIRDNNKIVDFIVSLGPVENPKMAGPDPTRSNMSPAGEENINGDTLRIQKMRKKYKNPGDPETKLTENPPLAKFKNYFDVLSYKLDQDGYPVDDKIQNDRVDDVSEDAAPGNDSIIPRRERLQYRKDTKPMQATAQEGIPFDARIQEKANNDIETIFKERKRYQDEFFDKYKKQPPDYLEIGVYSNSFDKNLTANAQRSLLTKSLDEDSKLIPLARSSNSTAVEPIGDGGQWCPKVRHAVPYYVCGQYCIDGRRIPQANSKEAETYFDYLTAGGHDNGMVYCGYKDWLKREVIHQYPGFVEDYIVSRGGEVTKNQQPFDHKMNLDEGQRRQMPVYPDHKLIEKRLENNHEYKKDIKLSSNKANKIINSNLKKK